MNITHYYLDAGYSTQPKNKLETAFVEYLKTLNGLLVEANLLDDVMFDINTEVKEMNETHSRCKPLNIRISKVVADDKHILFGCCLNFEIKPATLWQP